MEEYNPGFLSKVIVVLKPEQNRLNSMKGRYGYGRGGDGRENEMLQRFKSSLGIIY